jgi:hypothetical protein
MKLTVINQAVYLLVALMVLAGCKQDDLLTYKEDPRVYFNRGEGIAYTFSATPTEIIKDTLYIQVRIMGSAAEKDRPFTIIVDDSSTAKEGWHFELGEKLIPAGAYSADLPVYLYRRPGLKDSVVTAYFTIGESADFKPGYMDKYVSVDPYNKLHFRISIDDQLLRPSNWDSKWSAYFGTYSRAKHLFINQVYGGAGWTTVAFPQDINFLVQSARYALYTYEQANGPLMDENNERVVFP